MSQTPRPPPMVGELRSADTPMTNLAREEIVLATDGGVSLFQDRQAMLAVFSLLVATATTLTSIAMREGRARRGLLVFFALCAFGGGAAAAWRQHASKLEAVADARAARAELQKIRIAASAAAEQARVNELAPGSTYHLRLSVDPDKVRPCQTAAAINRTLHGTLDSGMVRVVYRAEYQRQPYCLLLGKDLSLSAAKAFQELAASNIWAHDRPTLEAESPESVVDCKEVLK